MNKIKKSSELLWVFGIVFVALGVAICSKANLGVSMIAAPTFVIQEAIAPLWSGFSVGVVEYLVQGAILVLLCLRVQRFNWRYMLAFAVAVVYGYTMNLFLWLMRGITFEPVWIRWVMLLVGDLITGFGVACFFNTYMPLQVFELFVSEFTKRYNLEISRVKWIFDGSLLIISLALAFILFGDASSFDWSTIGYSSFHNIGLGTLVTTFINSPIIQFMSRQIRRHFAPFPRFPKLANALRCN